MDVDTAETLRHFGVETHQGKYKIPNDEFIIFISLLALVPMIKTQLHAVNEYR